MKVSCPYCQSAIEPPSPPRHLTFCPECDNKFFTAGDLVFRYGVLLDEPGTPGPLRVACPYCGQHHRVSFEPMYNMLSCVTCLKIFITFDDGNPVMRPKEKISSHPKTIKLTVKPPPEVEVKP